MTAANIGKWKFKLGTAASPQVLTDIEEVFAVSNVGITNALEEVTNFDSDVNTREYIAGLADGDEITVEANYLPAGAQQIVAMVAADAGETRLFKLAYTGVSPEKTFTGSVVCLGYSVTPSPTARNTITFTYKITGALARA